MRGSLGSVGQPPSWSKIERDIHSIVKPFGAPLTPAVTFRWMTVVARTAWSTEGTSSSASTACAGADHRAATTPNVSATRNDRGKGTGAPKSSRCLAGCASGEGDDDGACGTGY